MSSARRSMAAQSSESKRKAAGKLSKAAVSAAAGVGGLGPAAPASSSSATATQDDAGTNAPPGFIVPQATKDQWAALTPTDGHATEVALAGLAATCLRAVDVTAQFAAIAALTTGVEGNLGAATATGKGKKAEPTAVAAPAASSPSVVALTPSFRRAFFLGLLELLSLKLATVVRGPLCRALELLDAPTEEEEDRAANNSTLLDVGLASVLHRLRTAPSIGLVILVDQLLPWKAATPFLANRARDVLPAATAALEEIIVKRFKTAASASHVTIEEDEEDEESSASTSAGSSSGGATATSAMWLSPSEQTRFLLRTLVTYVLRFKKEMQGLLAQSQTIGEATTTTTAKEVQEQHAHLRAFIQQVARIMQHASVHRDVLTQAGLILTMFLQWSASAGVTQEQTAGDVLALQAKAIYFTFFADPPAAAAGAGATAARLQQHQASLFASAPVLQWMHEVDLASPSSSSDAPKDLTRAFDAKLQALARLALLRSIATHSSLDVLLYPCGGEEEEQRDPSADTLLLGHLFPTILQACQAINPHLRAYALQSVDVLLVQSKKYLAGLMPAAASSVSAGSTAPASAASSSVSTSGSFLPGLQVHLSSVLGLLHTNFDHAHKPIPGIVKGIFATWIEARNAVIAVGNQQQAQGQAGGAGAEVVKRLQQEEWSRFAGQILHQSAAGGTSGDVVESASASHHAAAGPMSSSRGTFIMLLVLLPHLSILSVLRGSPRLLADVFRAARFRPVFGIANQVIEHVLEQARKEMITAPQYIGAAGDVLEEGDETNAAAAAAQGRSGQKKKKDEAKSRLKAKAAEVAAGAGAAAGAAAAADPTSSVESSAAAAKQISPAYQLQLDAWRGLWLGHIVSALYSTHAMWRSDVAACTLTTILKTMDQHPDTLRVVLAAIQSAPATTAVSQDGATDVADGAWDLRRSRALVTVLKTARRIGLVTSKDLDRRIRMDDLEETTSTTPAVAADPAAAADLLPITSSQLLSYLLHTDLDLRLECFEFLCHNAASTERISGLELRLLEKAFPYLLKLSVPQVRAKFVHSTQRFLLRVRDSVAREMREEIMVRERVKATAAASSSLVVSAEEEQLLATTTFKDFPHLAPLLSPVVFLRLEPSLSFFSRFLTRFLFASLYPSAPFERVCGVLEVLRVVLDAFIPEAAGQVTSQTPVLGSVAKVQGHLVEELRAWKVREAIFTRERTRVLVNLLASNWERVRLTAFELLERFPTPLPGYAAADQVAALLAWAFTLCSSARMRDAEGGALAVRLVVKKYVLGDRWRVDYVALAKAAAGGDAAAAVITAESASQVIQDTPAGSAHEAILYFLRSLHAFLRFQLVRLRSAPLTTRYADPHARVHGTLLVFRLVLSDVPWFLAEATPQLAAEWKALTADMITAMKDVAEVSLSLHIPTNALAALKSEQQQQQQQQAASSSQQMDCRGHPILASSTGPSSTSGPSQVGDDGFADQAGEQIVVVSSWLAVKEVSLGLGAWLGSAPLPTATHPHAGIFTLEGLRTIGAMFFSILSCSKHNGVLENAHQGFLAVCSTLLESGDAMHAGLVESWLGALMAQIQDPYETDAWIRRSRGVAYCLLAILQAEPTSQKQPAHDGVVGGGEATSSGEAEETTMASSKPRDLDQAGSLLGRCMQTLLRMARLDTSLPDAVTGVVRPDAWKLKVHGLNILRAIFRDSLLTVDAVPYIPEALRTSIGGFAHPNWNVRNSSLITFCALVSKAVRAQVRSNSGAAEEEAAATGVAGGASSSNSGGGGSGNSASSQNTAKNGMTSLDFFAQFPTLHGFLLDQLRIATTGVASSSSVSSVVADDSQGVNLAGQKDVGTSPASWSTADMHPSLYPILLLLSRLVPSTDLTAASPTTATQLDMHAFLPFIRHCASHPYYMARWMAAKAVVSLVPAGKLDQFARGLIEQDLPTAGVQPVRHNLAHGTLLQLHNLLQFHHASPLLSREERAALGRTLFRALTSPAKVWIGTATMRCATVRSLFLEVLEACVEYMESASSAAPSERKRLLVLAAAAADPSPNNPEFEGIAIDVLRANAATMVLRCACTLDASTLPSSKSFDLTGLLLAMSTRGSVAVQEALLWTLKRCLTLHPARMAALFDLARVARHILEEKILAHTGDFVYTPESNYTIQELALQLIMLLQSMPPSSSSTSTGRTLALPYRLEDHWDAFLAWTVKSTSNHVKGEAFVVLSGALDGEFTSLLQATTAGEAASSSKALFTFLRHAATWLELLHVFMDDEQPVALRYACVKAIQSSGMLKGRVRKSRLALPSGTSLGHVERVLPSLSFSSTSPLVSLEVSYDGVETVSILLWSSVIVHLLQDENETVRTDMSTLIGDIVKETNLSASNSSSTTSIAEDNRPSAHTGCTLGTRVLEQTFAFLHAQYGGASSSSSSSPRLLWRCLREYLKFYGEHFESAHEINPATATAAGGASPSPSPSSSDSASKPSAAAFKLFEHEKANTIVEELLLIELAAFYLAKGNEALATQQQAAATTLDAEWRETILSDLETSSSSLLQSLAVFTSSSSSSSSSTGGGGGWVGGASFLEEPFVRACGPLHLLASMLPLVLGRANGGGSGRSLAEEPRARKVVAELQAAQLTERADQVHPLLKRVLVRFDDQLRATAPVTRATSVGFLTNVAL